MVRVIQKTLESFYDLLFPSFCLHCSQELNSHSKLLCPSCFDLLELLPPEKGLMPTISQVGICFESEGPSCSLIRALMEKDMPYLAKSLASFMLIQHQQLGFSLPDRIIYLPQSFLKTALQGYNPNALLAKSCAELFQKPVQAAGRSFTNKHVLLVGGICTIATCKEAERLRTSCMPHLDLLFLQKDPSTEKAHIATKERKIG